MFSFTVETFCLLWHRGISSTLRKLGWFDRSPDFSTSSQTCWGVSSASRSHDKQAQQLALLTKYTHVNKLSSNLQMKLSQLWMEYLKLKTETDLISQELCLEEYVWPKSRSCYNKVQYHELSGGGKKLDLGSRKILIWSSEVAICLLAVHCDSVLLLILG